MSYTITNTAGTTVATINVGQTTGAAFPIQLIGQGISLYGPIAAENWYRMMENFAFVTPPTNPITGMFWYDSGNEVPNFYDGSNFIPLLTRSNSSRVLFRMLITATNIDFTTAGTVALFQAPGTSQSFFPTRIMLVPQGSPAAVTSALFNLRVTTREDVMENVQVRNITRQTHTYYPIEGTTRFLRNTDTLSLNILTPAAGGALTMNAYVFGFVH